jgi:hypothetical protein
VPVDYGAGGYGGDARLTAAQLSGPVMTNAAGGLARLLLLREPLAHMLDIVEDEAADYRARRTEAAGREALQRADGPVQLPREAGFADVTVENRRGWI